ncbi:SDR family NAD(P)-dependent oxidoreductase [Streptomyces coeruleorubidus]|uniref:SDR family NAD(P)-dependent oxidoreductase n=1 Tax=Streptomyces coeruleorubidus TaxID=116188 RepID=UPI00365BB3DA
MSSADIGGSRGIGLMIAHDFVAAGATVIISSRRAEACEKAAAELSALTSAGAGTCLAHPADCPPPRAWRAWPSGSPRSRRG